MTNQNKPSLVIKNTEQINDLTKVDDINELLSIPFGYAVSCKIDLKLRKAYIGRMEAKLKGDKVIPGGWRGKIDLVQGISRRITLTDAIVLPMMVPGVKTPIMPGVADIPRDIAKSEDSWYLEFYVVDPFGNEKLLLRTQEASFIGE